MYKVYFSNLKIFFTVFLSVIIITLLLLNYCSKYEPPKQTVLICVFTFALSLLWMWFSANILVSLLMTMADIYNIPDSFLGMTILTYGNSISDLILNVSLVRIGYGEMALSGSIAGPLFNLLLGLGISLLKLNINEGEIIVDLLSMKNIITIICFCILVLNLVTLCIHAKIIQYRLNVKLAFIRFLFYFMFFSIICIITFK